MFLKVGLILPEKYDLLSLHTRLKNHQHEVHKVVPVGMTKSKPMLASSLPGPEGSGTWRLGHVRGQKFHKKLGFVGQRSRGELTVKGVWASPRT